MSATTTTNTTETTTGDQDLVHAGVTADEGMRRASTSSVASHTTTSSSRGCPYAAALYASTEGKENAEKDGHPASSTTSSSEVPVSTIRTHGSGMASAIPAVNKCPAFQSGSCPFKELKSADQVRQALTKIPPSHFDAAGKSSSSAAPDGLSSGGAFLHVLQEMHQVQMSVKGGSTDEQELSEEFRLPGGCPVQSVLAKDTTVIDGKDLISFTSAMEDFSLSALMVKLIQRIEEEEEEEEEGIVDSSNTTTATLPTTTDELSSTTKGGETSATTMPQEEGHDSTTEVTSTSESSVSEVASKESQDKPRHSLSYYLKTGTAESHQAAEAVHFVANFARGKIDRNLYACLVYMLYKVYDKMETLLDEHAEKGKFESCHFPHLLNRTAALEEDVDFFFGNKVPPVSPATQDYLDRLDYVAEKDPLLLLAHAYTRYLGDLSGGRILCRVAKRALQLEDDGLAFYEFENIQSPKVFKDQYRDSLDALPLTQEQVDRLVGEANVAFCLNMRLFEELDVMATIPGSTVRPLEDALKYNDLTKRGATKHHGDGGLDKDAKADQCPFAKQAIASASDGNADATASKSLAQCPWPFVLLHDPAEGLRDWRTWSLIGLALCVVWSKIQN